MHSKTLSSRWKGLREHSDQQIETCAQNCRVAIVEVTAKARRLKLELPADRRRSGDFMCLVPTARVRLCHVVIEPLGQPSQLRKEGVSWARDRPLLSFVGSETPTLVGWWHVPHVTIVPENRHEWASSSKDPDPGHRSRLPKSHAFDGTVLATRKVILILGMIGGCQLRADLALLRARGKSTICESEFNSIRPDVKSE